MSPHEIKELVERVEAAFPDPPMTEATKELYARMLHDLSYDELDRALDELIATTMRLPTISRIRRSVIEPTLNLLDAEEAWAAMQTRTEDLHPLVRQAISLMGGSFNLRTSANPELSRVRFVRLYEDLRRRAVDEALAAGLRARRMQLKQVS